MHLRNLPGMAKRFLLLLALLLCYRDGLTEAVPVSVERLGDLRIERELRAPATVLSANRTVVTSEVTALIEEVLADVGASVEKGELLVRLDNDNARMSLAQTRASLAALDAQIVEAKQRLRKAEELLAKNFISDDELLNRRTNLEVLRARHEGQLVAIQVDELALARTRIRAPFDATVVQRQAQVGNFAQPGTQLLTLVQTDQREVDAELDPRYAGTIRDVTNLRYLSLGREYPIELLRLSNVIETDTRRLRARFRFSGEAAAIGSSGEIAWRENSGVVPVTLIVQRGSAFGVFAARNGKAEFIEIPAAQEGRPAVLDLPDDTLIISRGHVRLQQGDELLIVGE
jgi:RND family efflux transporter MFP subunit